MFADYPALEYRDAEAYVHRIGRTGRAGRSGDAILFVTPRERRLLGAIEKATRQKIEPLELPTIDMVNNKRIADFKQRISDTLATGELAYLQRLVEEFTRDQNVPPERIAAALAKMCIGDQPLILSGKGQEARQDRQRKNKDKDKQKTRDRESFDATKPIPAARTHTSKDRKPKAASTRPTPIDADQTQQPHNATEHTATDDANKKIVIDKQQHPESRAARRQAAEASAIEMERFRVEVGEEHGVKPENLVGAIANEAGLDSEFIGRIVINKDHSLVELPSGMPKFLLKDLKRVWVCDKKLDISRLSDSNKSTEAPEKRGKVRRSSPKAAVVSENSTDMANDSNQHPDEQLQAKREGKKKERHRNKKNKGKRT